MNKISIDPVPAAASRHRLPSEVRARDCPASTKNPYSPLLCLSLLLAIGLLVKIAKGPLLLTALAF